MRRSWFWAAACFAAAGCDDSEPADPCGSLVAASLAPGTFAEVQGLSGLPAEFEVRLEGPTTQRVAPARYVDDTLEFVALLLPGDADTGGDYTAVVEGTDFACRYDVSVAPLPTVDDPDLFLREMVSVTQDFLNETLEVVGTPDLDLRDASSVPRSLTALALAQWVIDHPDNPSDLSSIANGTGPLALDPGEKEVLARSLKAAGFDPEDLEGFGSSIGGQGVTGCASSFPTVNTSDELSCLFRLQDAIERVNTSAAGQAIRTSLSVAAGIAAALTGGAGGVAIGLANFAFQQTLDGLQALLPQSLTDMLFDIGPTEFCVSELMNQDPQSGEWTNLQFFADSGVYKITVWTIVDAILSFGGGGAAYGKAVEGAEAAARLGKYGDEIVEAAGVILDGIAAGIVSVGGFSGTASNGLFSIGPFSFGPASGNPDDVVQILGGNAFRLVDPNRYETTGMTGLAILSISAKPSRFRGNTISKDTKLRADRVRIEVPTVVAKSGGMAFLEADVACIDNPDLFWTSFGTDGGAVTDPELGFYRAPDCSQPDGCFYAYEVTAELRNPGFEGTQGQGSVRVEGCCGARPPPGCSDDERCACDPPPDFCDQEIEECPPEPGPFCSSPQDCLFGPCADGRCPSRGPDPCCVDPDDCEDCEGDCGESLGDPHLRTIDGLGYSFQAVGEFILTESTGSAPEFVVQARFEPAGNSNFASFATAAATRIGSDRVGFYYQGNETIRVLLNGAETMVGAGGLPIGGGMLNRRSNGYELRYPGGERLLVEPAGALVITVDVPQSRQGELAGLLGEYDGDPESDLVDRSGQPLTGAVFGYETLYGDFANSWRITQSESLFDYAPGESTATFTDLDFPAQAITLWDLDADLVEEAARTCRDAGVAGPRLEACTFDVAVTDDDDFAGAHAGRLAPEIDFEPLHDVLGGAGDRFGSPRDLVRLGPGAPVAVVDSEGRVYLYDVLNDVIDVVAEDPLLQRGAAIIRDGAGFAVTTLDGTLIRIAADGSSSQFADGLGAAFGLARDDAGSRYLVTDRDGGVLRAVSDGGQVSVVEEFVDGAEPFEVTRVGDVFVVSDETYLFWTLRGGAAEPAFEVQDMPFAVGAGRGLVALSDRRFGVAGAGQIFEVDVDTELDGNLDAVGIGVPGDTMLGLTPDGPGYLAASFTFGSTEGRLVRVYRLRGEGQ